MVLIVLYIGGNVSNDCALVLCVELQSEITKQSLCVFVCTRSEIRITPQGWWMVNRPHVWVSLLNI